VNNVKHPVDIHVGKRIRHRRWMLGMTQQQLADAVGIKFQQIQKYETGMNRVSASRLWDIATTLDVTIGFFFQGLGDDARETNAEGRRPSGREGGAGASAHLLRHSRGPAAASVRTGARPQQRRLSRTHPKTPGPRRAGLTPARSTR
jgi:transcriptional regulator with XRE-family HTH domain